MADPSNNPDYQRILAIINASPQGEWGASGDMDAFPQEVPGSHGSSWQIGLRPRASGGGGGGKPKPKAPPKPKPKPPAPKPPAPPPPAAPPSGGGGGTPVTPSMGGLEAAAGMTSGSGDGGGAGTMGAGSLLGPSKFRQGIGTRILPQMSQSLAALKQVY